jgi:hypothetical protein
VSLQIGCGSPTSPSIAPMRALLHAETRVDKLRFPTPIQTAVTDVANIWFNQLTGRRHISETCVFLPIDLDRNQRCHRSQRLVEGQPWRDSWTSWTREEVSPSLLQTCVRLMATGGLRSFAASAVEVSVRDVNHRSGAAGLDSGRCQPGECSETDAQGSVPQLTGERLSPRNARRGRWSDRRIHRSGLPPGNPLSQTVCADERLVV